MYQQDNQVFGRFELDTSMLDTEQSHEMVDKYIHICRLVADCIETTVEEIFNIEENIFGKDFGIGLI
ncbi:hypothetical protein D3C78_1547170 [compost metagenome]